jgi:hypothetical protein
MVHKKMDEERRSWEQYMYDGESEEEEESQPTRHQEVREKLGARRQPETGKKNTPVPNHTAAQKHKKMKREAGSTSTA